MRVTIYVYPEIAGDECEVEAVADVTFGTRARRYGSPEQCHPADPETVEWVSFAGNGEQFNGEAAFETWLLAQGASFDLNKYEEAAIEKASEDSDSDDDGYGDFLYEQQRDAR